MNSAFLAIAMIIFTISSYCTKQFIVKGIYSPVAIMQSNNGEIFPVAYLYKLNIKKMERIWVEKNIKVDLLVPSKAIEVMQKPDSLKRSLNDAHEVEDFYRMLVQYYYPLLNRPKYFFDISCVFYAEFLVEKNDLPIDPEFIRNSKKQSRYIYKNKSYKILKCLNFRPMVLLNAVPKE